MTVHIPAAFKKSRVEKIRDASNVLNKLQGLMSDIRTKENDHKTNKKASI